MQPDPVPGWAPGASRDVGAERAARSWYRRLRAALAAGVLVVAAACVLGCAQGRFGDDAVVTDTLLDAPRPDAFSMRRDAGCGSAGTACCAGAEPCEGILVCRDGVCRGCGRTGDPCCEGEGCNAGLVCSGGLCAGCGASGEACCPGAAQCVAGARCVSGRCEACECSPGERRTTPCERCGTRAQVCLESCTWGPIGECSDLGECEAGTVDRVSCGFCGERTRTCDPTCRWGLATDCSGGDCDPGATRMGAGCGACQIFECDATCRWPTRCTGCSCATLTGCRPSGCPGDYHVGRMVCDETCGPCGGLLNNPRCEPNCGAAFTMCGYGACPSGYHVVDMRCDEARCGTCVGGGPNTLDCAID